MLWKRLGSVLLLWIRTLDGPWYSEVAFHFGQAHHMFSRFLNLRIYEFFSRNCLCFVFLKVAFFRKFDSFFKSPNLQEKIFQKTTLNLKFKLPDKNTLLLLVGNLDFKLRIVFWNILFGVLEIWKMNHTFGKKATFRCSMAVIAKSNPANVSFRISRNFS